MSDAPIQSLLETIAFDPKARVDPHPILKSVREQCPIFHDGFSKAYLLTRYRDVRNTVNDRSLWRHPEHTEEGALARMMVEPGAKAEFEKNILFMDEPNHSRVRLPLQKAFYARITKHKGEIEKIVSEAVQSAPAQGQFDLMAEIAVPIPILVIAQLIGVEKSRIDDFRAWSEAAVLGLNPVRAPDESKKMFWGQKALEEFFLEQMELRRQFPREDLITDLVQFQAGGGMLSDTEIRLNLTGLLIGGNLTTTDLFGNGLRALLLNPSEMVKLRDDPSLISLAVEEMLRFDPPVTNTTRVYSEDRMVGGCPMKEHQSVWVSLNGANRDPAVVDQPDEFNITRKHVPHVSFGGGAHICVGAPLARLEAKFFFNAMLQRYKNIELVEQDITWRALPFFRGMESFLIQV